MEDMASLWSYQEGMDELKQRLAYTTLELESTNENMKQLLQHLKQAWQERDEARDQLQKLLTKLTPSTPPAEFLTAPPQFQPTKANSSITESNSLSDTYGSSPVDSLFDPVSSPELLSNIPNKPFVPEMPNFDQGCLVIDNFVKGKVLPEKGKLLQAVLGAGPLLQTLLVAGPLPRWRNPPPFQAFHIPPVSVNGCGSELAVCHKPVGNLSYMTRSVNPPPFGEIPSQMLTTTSMLNFASDGYVPPGKRQRFL
ncbi:hypothetical protein RHMOL_Rhmol01G0305400 [Rhododendron molle]|uniref:Uncharacterized protein n=1 Tax=Rhododendron molle TaxID=49168 RepID=A0ACC0Q8Z1_RHOML|nr:hypothetical protein RHMOL_Rhmol01G0305400 [Rhododendron molle]